MIYIIGLTLAFIFGCLMGYEGRVWKIDDAKPLDLKLMEEEIDVKDMAIIYQYKGGETGN